MKIDELLFETTGKVDSKHILNTSPHTAVPAAVLREIEEKGVTIERLREIEKTGINIYRYNTQITIHGIFPELEKTHFGGYKRLFQNKNASIGVKWEAVDYDKKYRIYDILKVVGGFAINNNSYGYYVYKQKRIVNGLESVQADIEAYKAICEKLKAIPYYGWAKYGIHKIPMFGDFLMFHINVNAIEEKHVNDFIQAVTGMTAEEAQAEKERKEREYEAQRAERERQYEQQRQENEANKQAFIEQGLPEGFKYYKSIAIRDGLQACKAVSDSDEKWFWKFYTYTLPERKRKFVRNETGKTALWGNKTSFEKGSIMPAGYYKVPAPEMKAEQPVTLKKKIPMPTVTGTADKAIQADLLVSETAGCEYTFVDYSEKAFAIFGDTKTVKDILKQHGGRFNPHLNKDGQKQPGWIFSKTKENELKKALSV